MRTTEQISLSAFLVSVHSVMPIISEFRSNVSVNDLALGAFDCWREKSGLVLPLAEKRNHQRDWDGPVCDKVLAEILASTDIKLRARMLSTSAKNAGAWLNALPSPSLGNLLSNDALRIVVDLRLGAVICRPHKCVCGAHVDSLGQHGLVCSLSAGRHSRHNAINDLICRSVVSSGTSAVKEPADLIVNNKKRPVGVTMQSWTNGKPMAWDVTVVDLLALTHLVAASETAGSAAESSEDEKRTKYRELEREFVFCPIGLETFGAFGSCADKTIKEIGHRLSEKNGQPRSTEFLRQRISIEIQRGNAISVRATHPKTQGFDEIYHVLSKK